ncbi:hypothetical protein [Azospirillum thermophilum]|uniref:hypothetical protein n=1 Tax=Azospirillum thermophilum TaxID=2202148 RepID=UPI001FE34CE2|nr:hypothetical protein [Azospirillum thermophilum]
MVDRRLRRFLVGLATATVLAPQGPARSADVLGVERTSPDHLRAPFRTYAPQESLPWRPRRTESQAVYSLPMGLEGMATIDHTLSRLCQRGAFGQKIDGYYWAATPKRRYGVAFSGGANLDDPQKQAKPGKTYFFHGQDSRCVVYVGDQAKLMPHYIGP